MTFASFPQDDADELQPGGSGSGTSIQTHPFSALSPDQVLDALAGVQLYGDGRLMALSS